MAIATWYPRMINLSVLTNKIIQDCLVDGGKEEEGENIPPLPPPSNLKTQ